MKVGKKNIADLQALVLGVVHILLDVTLRIDHHDERGRLCRTSTPPNTLSLRPTTVPDGVVDVATLGEESSPCENYTVPGL